MARCQIILVSQLYTRCHPDHCYQMKRTVLFKQLWVLQKHERGSINTHLNKLSSLTRQI